MYNRYIRKDQGGYQRVTIEDDPPCGAPPPESSPGGDGISGILRRLLDQLHLDHLDSGDLLLLAMLYLLYREKADEELLIALGLLLIL